MGETAKKELARKRRHRRVRKKVLGTLERPRLCVFKSNRHIYAQVINDETGKTLLALSTLSPEFKEQWGKGNKTGAARIVGQILGKKVKEAHIQRVIFDRGGFKYHGRVKALADGAREGGLDF